MVFHISYDLRKPGRDYSTLYEQIKKLGSWCHPVDSTWYVDTTSNDAVAVRDSLKTKMDSSDALIVTQASTPGAWYGLDENVTAWLKQQLV